ncbi:G-type lectin S-receptor-like serine/threonine-protein kinase At4g27290 [Salvia miltiorrhiza]|uniref:G-type lectin S-receptor-like serine/threonine-protein kinase At4g27290 n=1 Tax=Salvia miltiorrhiza TaxID=226208 RepID=UPI0025AC053E|nr:G-type lectin S-receptor-like serine/threonine-protein kinase At4g27290 [Salvia miltiorrhiza]
MAHFTFTRITTILCSLLHSIAFQSLTVGAVNDHILFPNQTLVLGQTLVSQDQVFEMGFFSPGRSSNSFLGIWYKSTPEVVVWVANRNHPITASQAAVFMISGNGSLVISSDESVIWSASSSEVARNPVVQLLDSGNLVVVDNTREGYLWQSFDYPTDTMLPGMIMTDGNDTGVERYLTSWRNPEDPSPGDFVHKIQNRGLAEVVTLRGENKRYRIGQWNGRCFGGGPRFPNAFYKPELVFKQERLISIGEPYQSSVLVRTTLDTSGALLRLTMNARKDKWNLALTFPQETCDEYASCGPNCICRSRTDSPVRCQCLKGYAPKFQRYWDLQDWSGGCTRTEPLNCDGGDGFLEVRGVKYPDMLRFWLNTTMSLGECKAECFKNCSCTAYANPFITNGGSGCLMWFGDLIDIKELSAADSKQNMYIRVPLSELDFNSGLEEKEKEKKEDKEKEWPIKLILISIASGILISALINACVLMAGRKRPAAKRNDEDLELPVIKMATIVQATNNFSTENMIGVGGFGPVYKGNMPSGEEIAVKRLSKSSRQGLEEFRNEVMVIAKLQHRNLVRLLGCCIEEEERMLIYEYLQNKSLDLFVFDHSEKTLLTWPNRYDIIMGIARGLLYLHHDSRLKIIHRDLKTSNILLDGHLTPKISDFGLARIFEEDQSLARTKRVIGTYGYMAPEYAIDGKFSVKSDIFSLGVVLLEIISGKKNRGYGHTDHYLNLLGHAWLLWKENNILELMDECLYDTYTESQVKRCMQVGLLCVQKFAEDRPNMSAVVSMLGSEGAVLAEPKEPGFFIERSSSLVGSCTSPSCIESENETITITDLEAR